MTPFIIFVIVYIFLIILWYKFNEKKIEKDFEESKKTANRRK